jgi:hypothetical protein
VKQGYVYILMNKAFGPSVVKIGQGKHPPDRAQAIYSGATGVPQPFDVVSAYSTVDSVAAEKLAHRRLRQYRMNLRREFFRVPHDVAKKMVEEACADINKQLGHPPPTEFTADHRTKRAVAFRNIEEYPSGQELIEVPLNKLKSGPKGRSTLTPEQTTRCRILGMIFEDFFPPTVESWEDSFSRDMSPERELKIWECMARTFLTLGDTELLPLEIRKEAYNLVLMRSSHPTDKVLREYKPKYMDEKAVRKLLSAYELPPLPIVARRIDKANEDA